jgi:two-component system, LytTR family, sensor kinase
MGRVVTPTSDDEAGARAAARRWLLIALIWCIPGVITGTQKFVFAQADGGGLSFAIALVWHLLPWQVYALATPTVMALGRRYRLERGARARGLAVHLGANAVAGALHVFAWLGCGIAMGVPLLEGEGTLGAKMSLYFLRFAHLELLAYGGILAVAHAVESQRRYREAAVARAQLEAELVRAQLDALKMQLHPHFLFNTLNAIMVLIRKQDLTRATRVLSGMSELLRYALENIDAQQVPLRQELEFIERYLEIEQIRFSDRLQVRRSIEPGVLDALVPNLILQPLVENALKHGIESRAGGGVLELSARRRGDRVRLEVRDDGVGLGGRGARGAGLGLRNVTARLEGLYGRDQSLIVEPASPGVRVVLELPLRVGEAPAAGGP